MTTSFPLYRLVLNLLVCTILCVLAEPLLADSAFLGVAAGDVNTSEAILWTRPAGAPSMPVSLTAFVSPAADFSSGVLIFAATATADTDYTAKVLASGLQPGTRYYYRFVDGATNMSDIGTFKTAPLPDSAVSVHFGFSGDMDGLMRPYALASTVPAQHLDFYLNCGDVIYETASNVKGNIGASYTNSPSVTLSGSSASLDGIPVGGTTFATRLQLFNDYNKKYREQFLPVNLGGQNCLKDFYAGQGNYTLSDNHELGNRQYINGGAPAGGSVGGPMGNDMPTGRGVDARAYVSTNTGGSGNLNNVNDTNSSASDYMNRAQGFQTLQQVFLNYEPIREDRTHPVAGSDPRTDGTKRLYFSQQWGQNAIYIQLDTRSYRDLRIKTANGAADDTGARADNPDRTYLGKTQLDWLKQTLLQAQSAGTPWKFVAISDPIDQIGPIGGALSNTLTSVNADGGKSYVGGYRAERNALFKFIADNNIRNVVFLATDDHQNRINEVLYAPSGITGPGSPGAGTPAEIQAGYAKVPFCISIVCGPLGATGPETITNHSFANIKAIADSLANAEVAAGVEPVGLAGYPGLHNVVREGDPDAATNPTSVDFYSPDTFNYNIFDVSADGKTLNISSVGIDSTAQNAAKEYDAINAPARTIFSFSITAPFAAHFTTCPEGGTFANDHGLCSALLSFDAEASGVPTPTVTCILNGSTVISSPFAFPVGVNHVSCAASNALGTDSGCSFVVTVNDAEAPVASVSRAVVSGDVVSTLMASDNCDGSNLSIFVKDSSQGLCGGSFSAGPYAPGTKVKLGRAKRASIVRGSDGNAASIKTVGDPVLVVTDAAGNTSCTRIPLTK